MRDQNFATNVWYVLTFATRSCLFYTLARKEIPTQLLREGKTLRVFFQTATPVQSQMWQYEQRDLDQPHPDIRNNFLV